MSVKESYLKVLKKRAGESRVYRKHQLIGLEIAELLHDRGHRSLYIKLVKESNPEKLLGLAKDIADKRGIKNKGAYFMAVLTASTKIQTSPKIRKKNR